MANIAMEPTKSKWIHPYIEKGVNELIKEGFVTLSASQAGLILRECRYEHQKRDLNAAGRQHIAVLADLMRRGEWRSRDTINFAKLGDRYILINGHHRLGAQVESGARIEWTILIHPCADEFAVAKLYITFDTHLKIRTVETILGAAGLAEQMGIPKRDATIIFAATPVLMTDFNITHKGISPLIYKMTDKRMLAAMEWKKEAGLWVEALKPASLKLRKRLHSVGAVAVALTTFRHQPGLSNEFWGEIAKNDGLRKGDPRHTYVNTIENAPRIESGASHTARVAASCWNAFYTGRSLVIVRISDRFPIRIDGTPVGE